MIVVTNRIAVAPDQEEAFVERLYDRVGLVERHPGFVRLEVLRPRPVLIAGQPLGHSAHYLVLTYWARPEDFVAWARSLDYHRAQAERSGADPFSGPLEFEVHERIQTTGDDRT